MRILVTGIAGFIGYHLAESLLAKGYQIIGVDNINDYYSTDLKYARLEQLGISKEQAKQKDKETQSSKFGNHLIFRRISLENREELPAVFIKYKIDVVCNLAAQAGVRYSLENPMAYVDSNLVGFVNLLECCRHYGVKHLVYASSSSVYGQNDNIPFKSTDRVDKPISLYAATKKSNELMAHTYSHLYGLPTTGLRFFTVYGPWGRPDMALFLFTDAILKGNPIKVFNQGNLERDFTYIDDIVEGLVRVIEDTLENRQSKENRYKLYNIGRGRSVNLMDFIIEIEKQTGKIAKKEFLPMQAGDVSKTWADTSSLNNDYGYRPETPIAYGIKKFLHWYYSYFGY